LVSSGSESDLVLITGFGLIKWLVPSSIPAIDDKSLKGLFFESIGTGLFFENMNQMGVMSLTL
jgi:hypothetical protein